MDKILSRIGHSLLKYLKLITQEETKRCGNNMPTRCNRCFFIAALIACSTCFGHLYAHHQELESIIELVAACGLWCCKDGKCDFVD